VPAINDLLKPFGIGLSDRVFDGAWSIGPGAQSQVKMMGDQFFCFRLVSFS